jgi:hypothetical protein
MVYRNRALISGGKNVVWAAFIFSQSGSYYENNEGEPAFSMYFSYI